MPFRSAYPADRSPNSRGALSTTPMALHIPSDIRIPLLPLRLCAVLPATAQITGCSTTAMPYLPPLAPGMWSDPATSKNRRLTSISQFTPTWSTSAHNTLRLPFGHVHRLKCGDVLF